MAFIGSNGVGMGVGYSSVFHYGFLISSFTVDANGAFSGTAQNGAIVHGKISISNGTLSGTVSNGINGANFIGSLKGNAGPQQSIAGVYTGAWSGADQFGDTVGGGGVGILFADGTFFYYARNAYTGDEDGGLGSLNSQNQMVSFVSVNGIAASGSVSPATDIWSGNWTKRQIVNGLALNFSGTFSLLRTLYLPVAVLTVKGNPVSSGSVSGGGTYLSGANVQITATANDGWLFTGWSDGSTNNPANITVPTTNITYTASFQQQVATPTILPNGGTFSDGVAVTLRCTTSSAKIYYTIDGSTPTPNSALYTTTITLTNSAIVQVLATKFGFVNSAVASAAFTVLKPLPLTITTGITLPVALKGVAYSQTLQAVNGKQPYAWTATTVPAGLQLVTSAGVLSGTPTKAGTTNFLVTVKDAATFKQSTSQTFNLTVIDPVVTFAPVMGTYTGLIIQTNNPTSASSGYIQIVLANNGSFAGNLTLAGVKTAYTGRFDLSGNATNSVAGKSVAMDLGFGVNRGAIVGTVTGGGFTSTLLAELPDTSKTWIGKYTLALSPADVTVTNLPQGYGYATLTVNTAGNGSLSGVLNDGTAVSVSAPVSQYGTWPLYVSLYNKAGACISWVTLTNGTASGVVDWFAPASKGYAALSTVLPVDGSLYTTGPQWSNTWAVTLSGGGVLNSNWVQTVTLNAAGKVIGANPLALSLTVSSGLVSGSFTPAGRAVSFKGLFLQAEDAGYGFFQPTTGQTGWFTITPAK